MAGSVGFHLCIGSLRALGSKESTHMPPRAAINRLFEQLQSASENPPVVADAHFLDDRTRALVSIGAAVCSDASTPTLQQLVTWALESGATEDEILGAFLAVGAAAGEALIVSITPRLSLALGYDVDEALERE